MKPLLICAYHNRKSLRLDVDGLIVNSRLYSLAVKAFPERKIGNIVKKIKKKGKLAIIGCNRIIPEREYEAFRAFIGKISGTFDYLLGGDYALSEILPETEQKKFIYDAAPMVASGAELSVLPFGSFVSPALSRRELGFLHPGSGAVAVEAFGYPALMYSRRPLLSLLLPKRTRSNRMYLFKEEKGNDFYRIYELKRGSNYGTLIYNKGLLCLTEELKKIKNLMIIRLDFDFTEKIEEEVIGEYRKICDEDASGEKLSAFLKEKGYFLDNSFLDQGSENNDGES